MTWQPIETAPKDGTLVALAPMGITGVWDFGAEDWLVMVIPLTEDQRIATDWTKAPTIMYEVLLSRWGMEPTHWMPLPAPPSQDGMHASDCAVHNAPAYEPGPCDCGFVQKDATP